MKRTHLDQVPWYEWSSPGGKFHGEGKGISEALGEVLNATIALGGHPFDLEQGRFRPGKAGSPFHSHSAQWECYYILSGTGVMRHGSERRAVKAGDVMMHPPGNAHQLINTGTTDLLYYLVADNPLSEFWHYPDSDKWGFKPGRAFFRKQDVDYFLGEEDHPDSKKTPPPPSLPPGPAATFVNVADLPWEERRSPKGKFHTYCRNLSLALGGIRNAGVQAGGHPFDLQIRRIVAGTAICPYHSHATQWELFVFTAGRGVVRTPEGRFEVGPGDVVLHPPGAPHQTSAAPDTELECLIVADNPPADICLYPDSNKMGFYPGGSGKYYRLADFDYFDGEE